MSDRQLLVDDSGKVLNIVTVGDGYRPPDGCRLVTPPDPEVTIGDIVRDGEVVGTDDAVLLLRAQLTRQMEARGRLADAYPSLTDPDTKPDLVQLARLVADLIVTLDIAP